MPSYLCEVRAAGAYGNPPVRDVNIRLKGTSTDSAIWNGEERSLLAEPSMAREILAVGLAAMTSHLPVRVELESDVEMSRLIALYLLP